MAEPRPLASLTAGLLARKGAARPAMRSPLHAPDSGVPSVDDLGWNDFGSQRPTDQPQVVPFAAVADQAETPPPAADMPVVVRQQQALQEQTISAAAPAVVVELPVGPRARKSALAQGRRAAFTLRLDAERHLALRVAATVLGRSAQQIVSDALDDLLARHPEIHDIAGQIHGRR